MAEKENPSGKNKLKVGVSWAQVVDGKDLASTIIATGVSSSACDSAKLNTPV